MTKAKKSAAQLNREISDILATSPTTKTIFVVQGDYGYGKGWTDLVAEELRKEAVIRLREYRDYERDSSFVVIGLGSSARRKPPTPYRVIRRIDPMPAALHLLSRRSPFHGYVSSAPATKRSHLGKPKTLDGAALAKALPAYKGWTPAWEYPGFLAFHRGDLSVFCTPDYHRPGMISIEVQNSDGTSVGGGRDIAWPMAKRTPASFMKLMRPVLETLAEKRASYPSGGGGRVVEGHGFVPHGSKARGGRIVPGKGWVPNK